MGKKRSEIKAIDSKKSRKDTFHKRKFGLLKKASELSTLCNLKLLLFFEDLTGKLIQYSSHGNYDPNDYFELARKRRTIIKFTANDYPNFFHKSASGRGQVKAEDEDDEEFADEEAEEIKDNGSVVVKSEYSGFSTAKSHMTFGNRPSNHSNGDMQNNDFPMEVSKEIENLNKSMRHLVSSIKVTTPAYAHEIESTIGKAASLLEQLYQHSTLPKETKEVFERPIQQTNQRFAIPQPYEQQYTSQQGFPALPDNRSPPPQRNTNPFYTSPSHGFGYFSGRHFDAIVAEEEGESQFQDRQRENHEEQQLSNYLTSKQEFPHMMFRTPVERNDHVSRQSSNLSTFLNQYKYEQQASRQSSGLGDYLTKEEFNKGAAAQNKLQKGGAKDYWTGYGRADSGMSDIMKIEPTGTLTDLFQGTNSRKDPQDKMMIMDDVLGAELMKKNNQNERFDTSQEFKPQFEMPHEIIPHEGAVSYEKINTSLDRQNQSFMLFSPLPLSSLNTLQPKPPNTGDWFSQYYQSFQPAFSNNTNPFINPSSLLNTSNLSDNSIMKSPRVSKKLKDDY